MQRRAFVFAGGGTGGHLYPGIAIAERLRAHQADAHVLFLCSDKPLDQELLAKEGAQFTPIPARPLTLRPRGLARLLANWGASVRAARAALQSLARQDLDPVVVAMGGYVAAPAAQAARAERAPVVLVNLDAAPGKANRWIARRARRCFTAAPVDERRFGAWERTPPIVRAAAVARDTAQECRRRLGLDPTLPMLLVTGASQGARSINAMMLALLREDTGAARALRGWQVLHQTGDVGDERAALEAAYSAAGVPARVIPYCDDMASAWGGAELALCRCGAGTVAEVWANAAPALFLPYPHHRDQHQRLNARPLVEAGGAVIETDHVGGEANAMAVGPTLVRLLEEPGRRTEMRTALRSLGPADGADRVARALLGLTERSRSDPA